jgi:septation ring formation regulator EzrA
MTQGGPPSNEVQAAFPYSQEQYQSLDAVLKKLNFLSALTEALMSLVKTLSQSQSKIAKSHQMFAKSLQKQFLSLSKSVATSPTSPNTPTLENLESKLSQYSELYSKAALQKSSDSQELLSSLNKKRSELKKVIKVNCIIPKGIFGCVSLWPRWFCGVAQKPIHEESCN